MAMLQCDICQRKGRMDISYAIGSIKRRMDVRTLKVLFSLIHSKRIKTYKDIARLSYTDYENLLMTRHIGTVTLSILHNLQHSVMKDGR